MKRPKRATVIEIAEILTLVERARRGDRFATWQETRSLLDDPGSNWTYSEEETVEAAALMLEALRRDKQRYAAKRAERVERDNAEWYIARLDLPTGYAIMWLALPAAPNKALRYRLSFMQNDGPVLIGDYLTALDAANAAWIESDRPCECGCGQTERAVRAQVVSHVRTTQEGR